MKILVVSLVLVAAVAAFPQNGRFVVTYDNSLERGVPDMSLEWIPSGAAEGIASTRSQKVEDLRRILNSGLMDRSDEFVLRTILNNPEKYSHLQYYVNHSGEVKFIHSASPVNNFGQADAVGGVQAVKK
ncbi:uncharacterized protein LOC135220782 [Macrobrachium nipponense]|uniref:uncharacterized protein LOC135220782 n=1 Tax=Macrobrachium nipponense TaxID=159736 RepID=UPI0030C863DE